MPGRLEQVEYWYHGRQRNTCSFFEWSLRFFTLPCLSAFEFLSVRLAPRAGPLSRREGHALHAQPKYEGASCHAGGVLAEAGRRGGGTRRA